MKSNSVHVETPLESCFLFFAEFVDVLSKSDLFFFWEAIYKKS